MLFLANYHGIVHVVVVVVVVVVHVVAVVVHVVPVHVVVVVAVVARLAEHAASPVHAAVQQGVPSELEPAHHFLFAIGYRCCSHDEPSAQGELSPQLALAHSPQVWVLVDVSTAHAQAVWWPPSAKIFRKIGNVKEIYKLQRTY